MLNWRYTSLSEMVQSGHESGSTMSVQSRVKKYIRSVNGVDDIATQLNSLFTIQATQARETTAVLAINQLTQKRAEPSKNAVLFAIGMFLLSILLIAVGIVSTSMVTRHSDSAHQQAQVARDNAIAQLLENPRSAKSAAMAIAKANQLDAQADRADGVSNDVVILSQILLGMGSAFLGAVLGWEFTMIVGSIRTARENREEQEQIDKIRSLTEPSHPLFPPTALSDFPEPTIAVVHPA
jgi:hypothetical protein